MVTLLTGANDEENTMRPTDQSEPDGSGTSPALLAALTTEHYTLQARRSSTIVDRHSRCSPPCSWTRSGAGGARTPPVRPARAGVVADSARTVQGKGSGAR